MVCPITQGDHNKYLPIKRKIIYESNSKARTTCVCIFLQVSVGQQSTSFNVFLMSNVSRMFRSQFVEPNAADEVYWGKTVGACWQNLQSIWFFNIDCACLLL